MSFSAPAESELRAFGLDLAGGALVREITGEAPSDYDYWGRWEDVLNAARFLEEAGWRRKEGHINPTYIKGDHIIQLCMTDGREVREVCAQFDFRACALYRDDNGGIAEAIEGALGDVVNRQLVILNRGVTTTQRVSKYQERGWTVVSGSELLAGPVTHGFIFTRTSS